MINAGYFQVGTMKKTLVILFLFSACSVTIAKDLGLPAVNTFQNREAAMLVLDRKKNKQLADDLVGSLHQQNAPQSLTILDDFKSNLELSTIEIEYTYLKLAEFASSQAGTQLNPAVLNYLINYRSQVRLIHPESAQHSLPLFNIRAVASGARTLQLRRHDLLAAQSFGQQPQAFLQHYLDVMPVSQAALRDASLVLAETHQQQLLQSSLQLLKQSQADTAQQAALTDLSADLGLQLEDFAALTTLIEHADNRRLPEILDKINTSLPAEQGKALLYQCLSKSPEIAAIAIHYLAGFSATDMKIHHDLLAWLAEPKTAAAAALGLSTSKRPEVKPDLLQLTASPHPQTARYARLALNLLAESALENQ